MSEETVVLGRKRNRTDPESATLVRECGEFLNGTIAEQSRDDRLVTPAWMWMNVLSHGDRDQLRRLVEQVPSANEPSWFRARRYLAGEVLHATYDADSLVRLQRAALIPLELELMCLGPGRVDPPTWVTRVLEHLADFKRTGTSRSADAT